MCVGAVCVEFSWICWMGLALSVFHTVVCTFKKPGKTAVLCRETWPERAERAAFSGSLAISVASGSINQKMPELWSDFSDSGLPQAHQGRFGSDHTVHGP